jgi:hypothetical protein
MQPLFVSRITEWIKMIIGKNHDFCAGELSVLWSEVIAPAAILPESKLIGGVRKIADMIRIWEVFGFVINAGS